MHSLPVFPICRVNCQPDAWIIYCLPVLALLAMYSIAIVGFGILLKLALMLLAAGYAAYSFRHYTQQAECVLVSNAQGALFLSHNKTQQPLQQVLWRDWGFCIELQAMLQGKVIRKCWLSARLPLAQCRQLRLLIKAQNRHAANSLPSVVTNPVL